MGHPVGAIRSTGNGRNRMTQTKPFDNRLVKPNKGWVAGAV